MGHIRIGESFGRESGILSKSFRHRAVQYYKMVPLNVRTGSVPSVKRKLKKWVWNHVPIDWN